MFATVWTLNFVTLHGICHIWACSPSILHEIFLHVDVFHLPFCMVFATFWHVHLPFCMGFANMWACFPVHFCMGLATFGHVSPSILHGISYMWACFTFHFAWHGNWLHFGMFTFHFAWDLLHVGLFHLPFLHGVFLHVSVFTTSSCQPQGI